jgi:beta-lactamase class A
MRLVKWLAWLILLVAQPAWAQVPPQVQFLEQRLAALAIENPGEYGFAAMDLSTGTTVSFNGDRPFPMASTMKVAVAAAYLSEVDAGRRSLDDRISGVTARQLMDLMITRSSNQATDQLLAALGGPASVDGWLRIHGLTGIRVDRTIAQLLSARRDLRDIRDSSTPRAMLELLRLVDSGNALSPQSRALLMDMMRRCSTGSNRIRALLPSHAGVEHKTGTLDGYTSDVGFLSLPGGRRIAVAFFARYGSNRPAVIATAARATYDAFSSEVHQPWPLHINVAPRTAATGLSPGALPAGACTASAGMNAGRC